MSESAERRTERKEYRPAAETIYKNAQDQLELRLRFAGAVSEKKNIPYGQALRDFTDIYVRAFGSFPGKSDEVERQWTEFVRHIESLPDLKARSAFILSAFAKQIEKARTQQEEMPYWPFRYEYDSVEKIIHLHFGTMSPIAEQAPDEPGILSKERYQEQREKLKNMFRGIRLKHPDAEKVWGSSWLYNREAYRRLYPASYTATAKARKGGFRGGGRWGQFRTKDGSVNPEVRERFFKNIDTLDPDNLEAAFPNQSLDVEAPIAEFYKEYGIE